jgi:putative flippase GtrA
MKPAWQATEIRRLVVYAAVGTLNTALCYAVFAALVHLCAWHHDLALAADYAFGIVAGYVLHRISTFADRKQLRQAFGKYTVTLLATFAANFVLLDLLVRGGALGPLVGQAVAMTVVTLASYRAQVLWVFRSHVEAAAAVPSTPPPPAMTPDDAPPPEAAQAQSVRRAA